MDFRKAGGPAGTSYGGRDGRPDSQNGSQGAEVGGLSGSTVVIGWGLGVALVVLTALGAVMTLVGGLGMRVGRGIVTAAARAVLQLAVVSAVIVAVVRSLWLSAVRAAHAGGRGRDVGTAHDRRPLRAAGRRADRR